jgi:hypothetical protein
VSEADRRLGRGSGGTSGRAQPVRWAAAIVVLQGVALTLGALAFGAWLAVTRPDNVGFPAGTAVIVLLFGVVLLLGGRALAGGARPSVSPILLVELLMLPVAWSMGQARQWTICAALAGPALAVLVLLATPAGRAVMRGEG